MCPKPAIFNAFDFRIDTGADITTISPEDAVNSGINFNECGQPFPVQGINGFSQAVAINDCILSRDLGDSVLSERMEQIHISIPQVMQ